MTIPFFLRYGQLSRSRQLIYRLETSDHKSDPFFIYLVLVNLRYPTWSSDENSNPWYRSNSLTYVKILKGSRGFWSRITNDTFPSPLYVPVNLGVKSVNISNFFLTDWNLHTHKKFLFYVYWSTDLEYMITEIVSVGQI